MKYQALPQSLYVKNRAKLREVLPPKAMAVFNSNDILPSNADGTMPFRQNNDLLYMSGIDQEESILIVFPDAFREVHREMLFLKETSEEIAIWEGAKLTKEEARELSGVQNVYWLDEFENIFKIIAAEAEIIFLNSNEHLRRNNPVETRDERFRKWCMQHYPLHRYERLAPHMHRFRSVKEPEEIETMRHACGITRDAFLELLAFVKPGVNENDIEALFNFEIMKRKSRGPAYQPIIASGGNACVLHYVENNQECKAGDVILLDIGAEYANYASDMTRCIPVSGKFTPRQKDVYNAVLRVMKEAKTMLRPGVYLDDYQKEVGLLMEKELLGLGLLTKEDIKNQDPGWPAYKKYFMHGTSHFIGLDTHDVGLWTEPIKAGMAFTVEPGIYIREEGLGIRLENDIIVREDGFDDLMGDIPLEADEIEALMNG